MDNKANKFLIIGAVVVIVAVIIVAIVTSGKDYSSGRCADVQYGRRYDNYR